MTNQGAAAAVGGWYDIVWFSTNGVLDANSVALGYFSPNQTVPAEGSYWQTNLVTLPMNGSGNYTLFVQVDANNAIYEANLGDKVSAGVSGTFTLTPATTFQNFSLTNEKFQFTFVGPPGSSCIIYGSTNWTHLFIWVPLLTNTPFNGSLNFVDPQRAQFPGRLYQAIIFP